MEYESNAANAGMPSVSEAMEKIMAHPELISMVASVLGAPEARKNEGAADLEGHENIAENSEGITAEPKAAAEAFSPSALNPSGDWMATLAPLISNLSGGKGGKGRDDPRSCLLRALKPYVSSGRREAIDYMIRLSQISDLFKHLS